MTFMTGNIKGSDYCYIDLGLMSGMKKKTHLIGCIGEIIAFYDTLNDKKTSHFHEYLMKSGELQIKLLRTDIQVFRHTKIFSEK